MENFIHHESRIPHRGDYDIIVAGGGVAGVAAAVAAARMGKRTLLIEKTVSLGGLATIGLINYFVPLCNGRGTQIIRGMAEEFLRLSIRHGFDTLPAEWREGEPGQGKTKVRYITRYSVPVFVLELTRLIRAEGVDLLFDTVVSEPIVEEGRILGVITDSKSGREYYTAKQFIDATGDADLLFRAGVPTVEGGNYDTYFIYGTTTELCKTAAEKGHLQRMYKEYFGGSANLHGGGHPEGKPLWRGTDNRDITRYFVENHEVVLDRIEGDDRMTRDLFLMPTMPQFRTTRHLLGDHIFRAEDAYRHFDDSIGAISDFERRDFLYEVPYRAITKRGFPNVYAVGRIASAEGFGWDVLRVIPPAILTGQAAGVAASLVIDEGVAASDVDMAALQSTLAGQDVIIHFDDALIPRDGADGETCDIGHI